MAIEQLEITSTETTFEVSLTGSEPLITEESYGSVGEDSSFWGFIKKNILSFTFKGTFSWLLVAFFWATGALAIGMVFLITVFLCEIFGATPGNTFFVFAYVFVGLLAGLSFIFFGIGILHFILVSIRESFRIIVATWEFCSGCCCCVNCRTHLGTEYIDEEEEQDGGIGLETISEEYLSSLEENGPKFADPEVFKMTTYGLNPLKDPIVLDIA
jgi:hypothetical protein